MKQFPFPLSVVLSVINGESLDSAILFADMKSLGVLFYFMTGDKVFIETNNHATPFAMTGAKVRSEILQQCDKKYPLLKELDTSSVNKDNMSEWLGEAVKKVGDIIMLEPIIYT